MDDFKQGANAFVYEDYELALRHLHKASRLGPTDKAQRLIALLKKIMPHGDISTIPKTMSELLALEHSPPILWVDSLSILIKNPAFLRPSHFMSSTTVRNFPQFLVVDKNTPQEGYCCNTHPRNLSENEPITIHYVSWPITCKYYYGVNLCHVCYHLCKDAFSLH